MEIQVFIGREDVNAEVGKVTDYTGAGAPPQPSPQGEGALLDGALRDRVLMSDEALEDLSRFWDECVSVFADKFKRVLVGVTNTADGMRATIGVSSNFNTSLTGAIESSVRSFFVASIAGQWFRIVNKAEAADYLTQAAGMLDAAERMVYARKRPSRDA